MKVLADQAGRLLLRIFMRDLSGPQKLLLVTGSFCRLISLDWLWDQYSIRYMLGLSPVDPLCGQFRGSCVLVQ